MGSVDFTGDAVLNKREILLRVEAPNFCAGAVYRIGKDSTDCIEVAPILRRWLAGKSLAEALKVLVRKERDGWRCSYAIGGFNA